MYDLWAVVTLHHTSFCEPLNVQLQHSNSGDRRLFPSKEAYVVFFPLQQKECFTRTWAPITYVKTNSLIFPLGATPRPPNQQQHRTLTWSCNSRTSFSSRFKQILELWLAYPHPPIFTTKRQCWYKTGHWDLPRTSLVKSHNLPISTAAQEPPPLPKNLHSNPYVVNSLKPY